MGLWPLKIKVVDCRLVGSHGRAFSVITQAFATWVLDALKTGMHQAWPSQRQVGFSLKCFLQIAEKMREKIVAWWNKRMWKNCEKPEIQSLFGRISFTKNSSTYLLVGEVFLLLKHGRPWPPPRNCLAFLCPNFWLCSVKPSPGVLRGVTRRRFGLSDLRFAPKFQSEKANGGEEAVETPNLQSRAMCVFSFFSWLVGFQSGKICSSNWKIFPQF